MTCVLCADHDLIFSNFLYYDYYYSIQCPTCQITNPSLDYAEVNLSHPFQTGMLRPQSNLSIWVPIDNQEYEQKKIGEISGRARVLKLSVGHMFEEIVDPSTVNSGETWDKLAQAWDKFSADPDDDGDFNHKYLIIPELLKLVEFEQQGRNGKVVLDIGAGTGNVGRKFARAGYEVHCIDYSKNMLKIAKQRTPKELGITFYHDTAEKISEIFDTGQFDIAYSNMALMDMDCYEQVVQSLRGLLKPGGIFAFSITHPIFAWPIARTIRMPRDSQRNEDRIWVVDNYLDRKPIIVNWPVMPSPMLYYPRTIGDYINTLIDNDFEILRVVEPEPTEELMKKFPRHSYNDYDRTTQFFLLKARRK